MSKPIISAAPTRRGDPVTSFEAAESVDTARMQVLTLRALQCLEPTSSEPFDQWAVKREVKKELGYEPAESTVRSRLCELVRKGLVVVVDREGTTPSGKACSRYRLAETGVAA